MNTETVQKSTVRVQSCDCLQEGEREVFHPSCDREKGINRKEKKLKTKIKRVKELRLLIPPRHRYFSHLCTHTYMLVHQPQSVEGREQIL